MDGWRDAQTWVKLIIHLPPSTSSGGGVKKTTSITDLNMIIK